jgi:RHS repeat-associated protein
MPFGELWYNQQASAYNERFKFTGKERDEETGYDYFGARNYTSAASIWLSVDPLADKYPGISPYAYCSWILLFGYISPSKTN